MSEETEPSSAVGRSRVAWTPPAPEEVAALVPQYAIDALLGRGGMGAVYRGRQIALDRAVAIKLLPLEVSTDSDFAARFVREARAMARLEHPHIIAVHDFGQTSAGHLYYVMEFIDGANLHDVIHQAAQGSGLTPEQALSLVGQVCDALDYAHTEGVVHRDIKPANILVDRKGRVKVADFGLARLTSPDAAPAGETQTGIVMGTPAYMSPEQMQGLRVDHRADIYSLGVTLYESLTGEVPAGTFDPASRRVEVDPRIDEVVARAMHPTPDRRFQSSTEMKRAIDTVRFTPRPEVVAAFQTRAAAAARKKKLTLGLSAAAAVVVLGVVSALAFKKPAQATAAVQSAEPDAPPADSTVAPASAKLASIAENAPPSASKPSETKSATEKPKATTGVASPTASSADAPQVASAPASPPARSTPPPPPSPVESKPAFVAAEAAAKDPARWKNWLDEWRTKPTPTNATFTERGLQLHERSTLTLEEPLFSDGACRVHFENQNGSQIYLGLRFVDSLTAGEKTTRQYQLGLLRDSLRIGRLIYGLTAGRTLENKQLAKIETTTLAPGAHTLEFRAVGGDLLAYYDGSLVASARDADLTQGRVQCNMQGDFLITEFSTLVLDEMAPAIVTVAAKPDAPAAISTPAPATPKPQTDVEKWLVQIEAPIMASYERDVAKPFETARTDLRTRYLAALDRGIAAASSAGKLEDALAWKHERETFLNAEQNIPVDDGDLATIAQKSVATALKPLRVAFRTSHAKFEADRQRGARAVFAQFEKIVAPNIAALTQRQRLDDALLLKKRREELTKLWLAAPSAVPAESPAAIAKSEPARAGSKPPPISKATAKEAIDWILSVGGEFAYEDRGKEVWVRDTSALPKGHAEVTNVQLGKAGVAWKTQPNEADFQRLAALRGVKALAVREVPVGDAAFAFLSEMRNLERLELDTVSITDGIVEHLSTLLSLNALTLRKLSKDFTGKTLDRLAKLLKLQTLSISAAEGFTDESLATVAKLPGLAALVVNYTPITDAGIAHLLQVKNLWSVEIAGNRVTVAGIVKLKELKRLNNLGYLDGRSPDFASDARQIAAALPQLSSLRIANSLSEEQMRELAAFRDLTELRLQALKNTDDTAAKLALLPKLGVLDFNASDLTDTGLLALKPLKKLRVIAVPGTKVTAAAALELEKAIPGCKVKR